MDAQPPFMRNLAFYLYSLLAAAGIAFYIVWGILYGTWNLLEARSQGVYSVMVILVGFGVVGMLLSGRHLPRPQ